MGLTNTIIIPYPPNCPKCGKKLGTCEDERQKLMEKRGWKYEGWKIQSKWISDRGNCWTVGEKIIIDRGFGNLVVTASGDDVWKDGLGSCNHCGAYINVNILIKNGTIVECQITGDKQYMTLWDKIN